MQINYVSAAVLPKGDKIEAEVTETKDDGNSPKIQENILNTSSLGIISTNLNFTNSFSHLP